MIHVSCSFIILFVFFCFVNDKRRSVDSSSDIIIEYGARGCGWYLPGGVFF